MKESMKKNLVFLLILCTVFISARSENVAALVITHADGSTTSYELFTKPRITFVGDSVKITSPTVSAEYLAKDVLRFNYKMPVTAIEKTIAGSQLSSDGEYLVFGGNVKATDVKLFTANGIAVDSNFSTAPSGIRLRLSSLQNGVYLVNINGRTTKFMKR